MKQHLHGQNTTTTKINEKNGKLEDILKNNDKFVSIGPKQGGEISNTNPVELTINLANNEVETEEITISPSSNPENNIQGGEAEIIYDDNGVDKTLTYQIGNQNGELIADAVAGETLVCSLAATTEVSPKVSNKATIESDGTIVIDLGNKVAVKKITIRVTSTKSKKLADIAKVEFLNEMEKRVPAPVIESPSNIKGEAGYDSLVIYWDAMTNVTGYELEIKATLNGTEKVEYHQVDGNQITLKQFYTEDFKDNHYTPFHIRVQSVNGEWRSGYSEPITLIPVPNGPPAEPDNLYVKGGIREITATWKNMKSTRKYNVRYKKSTDPEDKWITAAQGLETNSIKITNLEDKTKYQVQVQGVNEKGEGPWCLPGEAETTVVEPAILPRYNALNLPKKDSSGRELEGVLTENIVNATYGNGKGRMVDSPLDTDKKSAKGTVDNTFTSYYQVDDWDDGGYPEYTDRNGNKGITVEFNKAYDMNYFTFAQIENLGEFLDANIYYWEEGSNQIKGPIQPAQIIGRTDSNGRDYTVIKLKEKIKAKKVNIQVGRRYGYTNKITIAEMRFYKYDSLEDEVNDLFKDQMHIELKDNVDSAKIEGLQKRLDTTDQNEYCPADKDGKIPEHNGEFNPEKDSIQIELNLARDLLNDKNALKEVVSIDTSVTTKKDGNIPFLGGLNAWQPLGVTAYAKEKIKIYVGNPNKKIGQNTDLKLVSTQYHAEAAYWKGTDRTLKVGINEIEVPQIITSAKEKGGSLYIEYTGNNPNDQYKVRVCGGEKIPVLNLSKLDRNTDKEKRLQLVGEYLSEIKNQVKDLETNHNNKHSKIEALNYKYETDPDKDEDCILGATEIVLDQMMYSVSARQILKGLQTNTAQGEEAEKLNDSLTAMEDMIDLFYSHKGLDKNAAADSLNRYPVSRLNIRYHKMFAGAAMYAGGQHIGIPYKDVPTLAQGKTIKTKADGRYESGNYFGWGISHEIGHIINESYYVHGEVTNNYFSVLSQAQDTNETVRFKYPDVYKKVTSGKTGKAQNVFTQLGLYWQFHLANDKGGYNFETYETYDKQLENLVFARMDKYAREFRYTKKTSAPKAEGEKGIDLVLDTTVEPYVKTDNNLMRLACAATQHNVLTFFKKWGMEPDPETEAYAEQFEPIYEEGTEKEKAIWYINDDARAYQLQQKPRMSKNTTAKATVETGKDQNNQEIKNQKVLTLTTENNQEPDSILGYEISRVSWAYGEEIKTPVGFVTADELAKNGNKFTDTIESINNRVFEYRIVAYDKYLNSTNECKTEQFKIEHDGKVGKKVDWEISTNFLTEDEKEYLKNRQKDNNSSKSNCSASENETNGEVDEVSVKALIDNDYNVNYVASAPDKENGQITIALSEVTNLVGLKYTTANKKEIANCTVEVSSDGKNWEFATQDKVGAISRAINNTLQGGTHTIYFNPEGGDKLCVYPARYVRITTTDKNISISEIDLLGQTGDNIDFIKDLDGNYSGIGILENEVSLGKDSNGNEVSIPANSIIFTGTYKGNPAYNTPVLYDNEGNPIEIYGTVFAEPIEGDENLGELYEGIWIYWAEQGEKDSEDHEKAKDYENYQKILNNLNYVRAELYRTDHAMTLEGERLTSDTYLIKVPRDENGNLLKAHINKDDSNTQKD